MSGVDLIVAERLRQVEVEGYTAEHDDDHRREELARAAAWYALPWLHRGPLAQFWAFTIWPPHWRWPGRIGPAHDPGLDGRIRQLVKAGALVAAEIDRLLRQKERTSS